MGGDDRSDRLLTVNFRTDAAGGPFRRSKDLATFAKGLRKAGLPE
jgi:hypothetical protein